MGGLSGHLCAWTAGSRVRGKGSLLSPCLGHSGLGVDRHRARVREPPTRKRAGRQHRTKKRANTDRAFPMCRALHMPLRSSESPFCRGGHGESQWLSALPEVTRLASGGQNTETHRATPWPKSLETCSREDLHIVWGCSRPYLRPLPLTPKWPPTAGAEDTSAGMWTGERRQQGKESSCYGPGRVTLLVSPSCPGLRRDNGGLAPLERQTPSLPPPSPSSALTQQGDSILQTRAYDLLFPFRP